MARIRTIKPEFWQHPVMSRMDDSARMLAVALLNLADDEGYFYADPALIRSSVWPFDDDSSKARRALEQLSKVGWIEVVECDGIGQVGRVVNFTKHQKVDRPSPSKIKGYAASPSIRRALVDDSLLEQGTGNREQGKRIGTLEQVEGAFPDDQKVESETPTPGKPSVNGTAISLKTFLSRCKANAERPIGDYRPVWEYAEKIGLPEESVVLCWQEFARKYGEGGGRDSKRYRDWRRAFRNCVEENWFRLWALDEQGRAVLTNQGRMAEKVAA